MPAPAKTSDAAVVAAARALLEGGGPHAVSMQAVAEAVGIRPPSLYKRFRDRAAILAAIEFAVFAEIDALLATTGAEAARRGPRAMLEAQVHAYRAYAARNRQAYALIYGPAAARDAEHDAARGTAVRAALEPMAAIVGPDRALTALRTLTAYVHGFISVEAAELFRLGGDLDGDFAAGVAMILDGIAVSATATSRASRVTRM